MTRRRPISNAAFYSASASRCRQWVDELTESVAAVETQRSWVAGIVPHAGWRFSGAVAAQVWKNLQANSRVETVLIFGAVHYPGIEQHSVYPTGSWETPLGDIEVDAELAKKLEEELGPFLVADAAAHEQEHSIEVQLPFVKALFPDCRLLAVATPPRHQAKRLGEEIGRLTQGLGVVAVGSTDLTHYGERFLFTPKGRGEEAHEWMLQNDRRMVDLMLELNAQEVEHEAELHHNACGPGAVAATLAFAKTRGVRQRVVIEHTTSHDVHPEGEFRMAVGYAGLAY